MRKKVVFVTGCFRSGTTLTARLLHQNDSVAASTDIWLPFFRILNGQRLFADDQWPPLPKAANYFYATERPHMLLPSSIGNDTCASVRQLTDSEIRDARKYCYYYGYRFNDKHAHLAREGDFRSVDDFIKFLLDRVVSDNRASHILLKETWCIELLPIMLHTIFDIKFVFIVRDIRSVVASKNHSLRTKQFPILHIVRHWKHAINTASLYRDLFPDRIVIIRYEDMITNTKNFLSKVSEFCEVKVSSDISISSRLLDTNGTVWPRNSSFISSSDNVVIDDQVWRWKTVLREDEIGIINLTCQNELYEYDYIEEPPTMPSQIDKSFVSGSIIDIYNKYERWIKKSSAWELSNYFTLCHTDIQLR